MLGVAVICLIFIFSVPDESSYCCVSLGNKKKPKICAKSQITAHNRKQFCQSYNADNKSKTKILQQEKESFSDESFEV